MGSGSAAATDNHLGRVDSLEEGDGLTATNAAEEEFLQKQNNKEVQHKYHRYAKMTENNPKRAQRFNSFFLCVHLGWFFENPCFPRELFIQVDVTQNPPPLPMDQPHSSSGRFAGEQEAVAMAMNPSRQHGHDSDTEGGLDSAVQLRPSILYVCCPYLSELKVVML